MGSVREAVCHRVMEDLAHKTRMVVAGSHHMDVGKVLEHSHMVGIGGKSTLVRTENPATKCQKTCMSGSAWILTSSF